MVLDDIGPLAPALIGNGLDLEEECPAGEVLGVESPSGLTSDCVLFPIVLGITAESHTITQNHQIWFEFW
jgi:hypothetical protein